MKKTRYLLMLVAGAAALAVGGFAAAGGVTIGLTASGPQPGSVTASLGDTVTFANNDSVNHVVSARRVSLTTPAIPPGGTLTYVLTTSGQLSYRQEGGTRGFGGEIVVERNAALTLATSKATLIYGEAVRLSGRTSLAQFPVTIYERGLERTWKELRTVTPAADGSFSLPVTPTRSTEYQARALGSEVQSEQIGVGVKPRLTVTARPRRAPTGTKIDVVVRIAPANAAGTIDLKRWTGKQGEWRRVLTRPVVKGAARFSWEIGPGRSLLRGWLKRKSIRAGYRISFSPQILVVGIGGEAEPKKKEKKRPGK